VKDRLGTVIIVLFDASIVCEQRSGEEMGDFSRTVIALFSILLISGCATAAQMQAQKIRSNDALATNELKTCLEVVRQSPDFDALREHIPLNFLQTSLAQMSDDSKVTEAEIKAFYATDPPIQACRKTAADRLTTTTPALVPIVIDDWQQRDELEIALIKKKITWGEFISRAKENAVKAKKEVTLAMQQLGSQLQQDNTAELQRRQQAAHNAMQYFQNQQIINDMNRPRTTSCSGFGNMVNCTTY